MLDLLLFAGLPIVFAIAVSRAFDYGGGASLTLTAGAVVAALGCSCVWPDVVTLSSPDYGPLHGVATRAFAYAAGVTGGAGAAFRAVGLSAGAAASIGTGLFVAVTGTGCWIA